jgi:hypothetical protein
VGAAREKHFFKDASDRPIQLAPRPLPSCNGIFVVWQPLPLPTPAPAPYAAQRGGRCTGIRG